MAAVRPADRRLTIQAEFARFILELRSVADVVTAARRTPLQNTNRRQSCDLRRSKMGPTRFELVTSSLSGTRSNQLSYEPARWGRR